ncbi:MAG: hypothetical protein JWO46_511 [Nocardioidaceae bacterium]|nr:hypothetical protein [Nocardioidaceae bacterium]
MTFYADLPVRRLLQVTGDLLLVLWIWLWIRIAHTVHDSTLALAKPGREINSSATGLAERLREAGEKVGSIPYVGDSVQKPFDGAGGSADKLAAAGQAQVDAVQTLAHWLGLAVALIPILIVLAVYLPPRIRFVRRATAGRRFLDSAADLDLFALRAMANQPLHVLAKISADPARGWRDGDPEVVRRLAALELRDSGLRPPPALVGS